MGTTYLVIFLRPPCTFRSQHGLFKAKTQEEEGGGAPKSALTPLLKYLVEVQ